MFACFPADGSLSPIFESAEIERITPVELDEKFVTGWRHFGTRFFRCNFAIHDDRICGVLPLRVPVREFVPSKSQRRVARRCAGFDCRVIPAALTDEYEVLFERHKARFSDNIPDGLTDFIDPHPAEIPNETRAVEVRTDEGRLVAVSFFDVAAKSVSSIYGMFDPEFARFSLGVFTILRELEAAAEMGKELYYLGYCYTVSSPYDYKLRVLPLEAYDWNRGWTGHSAEFRWSRELENPE